MADDEDDTRATITSDVEEEEEQTYVSAGPSPLKRAILLIIVGIVLSLAYSRIQAKAEERRNKVIYAKRYSEQYKFRPAASPIITESLKGGGTRLRGALPSPTPTPKPEPTRKKRKRRKRKSPSTKKNQ